MFPRVSLQDSFISSLRTSSFISSLRTSIIFLKSCDSVMLEYSELVVIGLLGSSQNTISWLFLILLYTGVYAFDWDWYNFRCWSMALSFYVGIFLGGFRFLSGSLESVMDPDRYGHWVCPVKCASWYVELILSNGDDLGGIKGFTRWRKQDIWPGS